MDKVFELVEKMTDKEFAEFEALYKDFRITEEELENILQEKFGITIEEFYEYFDED